MYIHGDIDIKRIDSIPKGAKVIGQRVAEGETTGHEHRLKGSAQVLEFENQKYIQVDELAQIVHEEHKPITLEPGLYKVEIEKEEDWFEQEIRKVMD